MNTKRVLLLDDDQVTLTAVGNRLQRGGFDVTSCARSSDAVPLALRSAWDLIILDLNVDTPRLAISADFSGLTLLKWLRSTGRSTPVILLTASESSMLTERAKSMGASEIVRKSEPASRLLEVAEAALKESHQQECQPVIADPKPRSAALSPALVARTYLAVLGGRLRSLIAMFF